MKLDFALFFLAIAQLAVAAPKLKTRASVDEVASIGYAAQNGGTSGGSGGSTTTVTTLDELTAAVEGDDAKIVIVSGTITGDDGDVVKVGSNTSVLGESGATLVGVGLRVLKQSNVIIRNLKIQKVLAPTDAIGIQASSQIIFTPILNAFLYDGLLDITHGSTGITVSNSYLHDHYKASLVGHSDSNGSEDKAITVTYALNHFSTLNSRTPSFRFGTGHIFNNLFTSLNDGINTRDGAQLLVENNVFEETKKCLYSTDEGYAVANGNDFGEDGENTAEEGTLTDVGYEYDLVEVGSVKSTVEAGAGATLDF
ncbi:polysaccharide lyase family 1 [Pyrrhoderma noxium]|uniref:Polysaccharide lyase family 1 n=1 Tax=Pyrrhoderma noxium TaxID=2282107 RepID=A0A286UE09_9AGAM|nr:polysaccharide lyase family 1 [Pyrrhoderma noxium]